MKILESQHMRDEVQVSKLSNYAIGVGDASVYLLTDQRNGVSSPSPSFSLSLSLSLSFSSEIVKLLC